MESYSPLTKVSKGNSYVSFEGVLKRPIYNIRLNISICNRLAGAKDFKSVLSFSKIDVCRLTEQIDTTFAVLKPKLSRINETLNGLIQPCPYKSLKYPKVSHTLNGSEKFGDFHFPSGNVKVLAQIYNNRDRNILFFEMTTEQNIVKSL